METSGLILDVIAASWDVLCESSPFILFGFLVAGLLKGFIPDDFIRKHLGGQNKRSLLKASLFGIPIPLCSCGVIPAAAGLRQQGASKGAVSSFMISTPETGVDSMAITYALLDPIMTIIRPVAAFFTALFTGLLVNLFDKKDTSSQLLTQTAPAPFPMAASSCCASGCGCREQGAENQTATARAWKKIQAGLSFAFGDLLSDIGPWLLFGIVLSGVISVSFSPTFIENYLGGGLLSMLTMMLIATPLYICATSSTPIAAALALKGLSPGAALVFLLAGPATNMATITVVARLLGRKTAIIYVGSIMACSLLLGLAVNWFYFSMGLDISSWISSQENDSHGILYTFSAIFLLLLILIPWINRSCRRLNVKHAGTAKHHHHGIN